MAELHELNATALAPLYAEGAISPVEVTQAVLRRVEACEPRLHATWALDADAALDMARASQARWRTGQALGR